MTPPSTKSSKNRGVVNLYHAALKEDTTFPVYGHFNSGYPFLGVDTASADLIEADL